MQIVVLADALQRQELSGGNERTDVTWIADEQTFLQHKEADAFIDLAFINTNGRKDLLNQLLPKLVVINSVSETLSETNSSFVRINGWATFLSSSLVEASALNESVKPITEQVFGAFGKKVEWLADDPGFVISRVVSMIVNEAFLALGENVSTKEEINTAMKLGTAYPYGPFEWAEKIGLQNVVTLLEKLSKTQTRYQPAELLVQETDKAI